MSLLIHDLLRPPRSKQPGDAPECKTSRLSMIGGIGIPNKMREVGVERDSAFFRGSLLLEGVRSMSKACPSGRAAFIFLTPLLDDVIGALRPALAIAAASWALVLTKASRTNPATWSHLPMTSMAFLIIIVRGKTRLCSRE